MMFRITYTIDNKKEKKHTILFADCIVEAANKAYDAIFETDHNIKKSARIVCITAEWPLV